MIKDLRFKVILASITASVAGLIMWVPDTLKQKSAEDNTETLKGVKILRVEEINEPVASARWKGKSSVDFDKVDNFLFNVHTYNYANFKIDEHNLNSKMGQTEKGLRDQLKDGETYDITFHRKDGWRYIDKVKPASQAEKIKEQRQGQTGVER